MCQRCSPSATTASPRGGDADRSAPDTSEDGGPVVFDAHDPPVVGLGSLECALGSTGVAEFALGIVVEQQEPQGRLARVLGELEHLHVAVGVPGRQQWASAGPVPDPYRLLRAVVEVVDLRLVGDGSALLIARVSEGAAAADHPLAGDAVDVLADRTHEIAAAAGDDVVREAVCLQVVE